MTKANAGVVGLAKATLTSQERLFISTYVATADIAAAIKKSRISWKHAKKLLGRDGIKRTIEKRLALSGTLASPHEIARFWTLSMRGEITRDQVISSGEVIEARIDHKDRLRASELLAKSHGMLIDKQQVQVDVRAPRKELSNFIAALADAPPLPATEIAATKTIEETIEETKTLAAAIPTVPATIDPGALSINFSNESFSPFSHQQSEDDD